jgi:hypothetical protein
MRFRWNVQLDPVAGPDGPSIKHDAHDSGCVHAVPIGVSMPEQLRQPFLEIIDLRTRLPQPGQFDDSAGAELQTGTGRKGMKVESLGRDVFAELAGTNPVASLGN